jgi:hypothetical protein
MEKKICRVTGFKKQCYTTGIVDQGGIDNIKAVKDG